VVGEEEKVVGEEEKAVEEPLKEPVSTLDISRSCRSCSSSEMSSRPSISELRIFTRISFLSLKEG